ncbi:hypothetical protein R1sor_010378 [Riccia sorocarpa]|uniref:Uncharacterized protein n=1 Tax=Riccia sorocarpa TaxID=122646 RepID=A0ABD3HXV2_9MARC
MNARMAAMGRKDLHEVLKAKLQRFHIKNHLAAIAYFYDINLTCTIANNDRKVVFTELNKALHLWGQDILLHGMSFITGYRTLKSKIDKEGVDVSYEIISEWLKHAVVGHQKPHAFYEHMKSIFDSYVNLENDPETTWTGSLELKRGGYNARLMPWMLSYRESHELEHAPTMTDPDSPPTSPPNPMELVKPISGITPVMEEPKLRCASEIAVVWSTPSNVINLS